MNNWLRKLHIYLQGFWRAAVSWKKIQLAEELGACCLCFTPINPLGSYLSDSAGKIWHGGCAKERLAACCNREDNLAIALAQIEED